MGTEECLEKFSTQLQDIEEELQEIRDEAEASDQPIKSMGAISFNEVVEKLDLTLDTAGNNLEELKESGGSKPREQVQEEIEEQIATMQGLLSSLRDMLKE